MDIKLNPALEKYVDFTRTNDKNAVGKLEIRGADGAFRVCQSLTKGSGPEVQRSHNKTRDVFFDAVAKQFGGADKIPSKVRETLYGKEGVGGNSDDLQREFLTGAPLRAHHIQKVVNAIKANKDVFAQKLIRSIRQYCDGRCTADELKKAVKEFFKAALPPHWETSRNYNRIQLRYSYSADKIDLLGARLDQIIGADRYDASDEEKIESQIFEKLKELELLFSFSKKGKKEHVVEFEDAFRRAIHDGGDVDAKFVHDGKSKTDEQWFGSAPLDKGRTYALDEGGATDFVRDMFHAAHQGSGFDFAVDVNSLGFNGEESKQEKQFKEDLRNASPLISWLVVKMLKSCSVTSIMKSTNDIGKVLFRAIDGLVINHDDSPSRQIKSFFKRLESELGNLRPGRVHEYDGNVAHKEWVEMLISKVESVDLENIGGSLRRQGAWTPFESGDIEDIRKIAQCACGSKAGAKGGAGYMGLLPGGNAFKCLKNGTQRFFVASGLSEEEKANVSQATINLKRKLVELAGKIDSGTAAYVSGLLEVTDEDGVKLLLRTNVAKALSYMEPFLVSKDGKRFEWDQIRAIDDSYSSLREVAAAFGTAMVMGDSEDGLAYVKRMNEQGIVFSLGKFEGAAGAQAKAVVDQYPVLSGFKEPEYVNNIASAAGGAGDKSIKENFFSDVKLRLADLLPNGVPRQFSIDAPRSRAFVIQDGSAIKKDSNHQADNEARLNSICDSFAKKIFGRDSYGELVGDELKLVQLAMAMMNQNTLGTWNFIQIGMFKDQMPPIQREVTNDNDESDYHEYQVRRNEDGSVTIRGYLKEDVSALASNGGMVWLDREKSYRCFSFEITYSKAQLDMIFASDWALLDEQTLKTDSLKFYYTCHLDA